MDLSRESDALAFARLSPEEQAASDAFERSDGNRAELEVAIRRERDPQRRALLLQEYGHLFDGAPRDEAPEAAPSAPAEDDDPFAAYDAKYGGGAVRRVAMAGPDDDPFAAYDAKYTRRMAPTPKSRNAFAVANDTVITAANAVASGAGAVADFVSPGNAFSKGVDEFVKQGEESQSDVVKASREQFRQEMADAAGWTDEVLAVLRKVGRDPLQTAAEAAGSFAVPGAAVKGAGLAGRALGLTGPAAGTVGGAAAGAALAGGDAAGTAYDLVQRAPTEVLMQHPAAAEMAARGADEQEIRDALGRQAGHDASVLPALVGAVSGMFGAERLLAGGKATGGVLARGAKTAAVEAVPEAFEEGITQFEGQRAAAQFDPSIDATKGVAGAAAMGGITGGVIGGVVGALTPGEHTDIANKQRDDAAARLGAAATVEDMIGAAEDLARRPNDDIGEATKKISAQAAIDALDTPDKRKADEARLRKLQEAIDIHSGLVEHASKQANETERAKAQANVAGQLRTELGAASLTREGAAPAVPDINETPLMQGRYTGPLREQATDEARVAAGLPTAEAARLSAPMRVTPGAGQPGPLNVTKPAGVTAQDAETRSRGAQPPLKAPETAPNNAAREFDDLTPMTRLQAKQRLTVLRDRLRQQGGDPESLQIVRHPDARSVKAETATGVQTQPAFAIRSLDPATPLSKAPREQARDMTKAGPQVIDPADAFVKAKRAENTPAARAFVRDFDAGKLKREDVLRAAAAGHKKRTDAQVFTESHGFVAPDAPGKPRGESTWREMETGRFAPPPKIGDTGLNKPKAPQEETPTDTPEDDTGGSQWDKKPEGPATKPASPAEIRKRLANNDEPGNPELKKAWQAKDLGGALDALSKSNSPTVRRITEMARKLVRETKITEWPKNDRVRTQRMDPSSVMGFYDPLNDTLTLRPDLKRKGQAIASKEASEWVAAHEIMHALSTRIIRDPTEAQRPTVNKLAALFDHVKKNWSGAPAYGLTNLHEFLSEGWTNPDFQAKLAAIPYKKGSAWSKFVDYVAQLLGFTDNNALTELLSLSERLTKGPRKTGGNVFGGGVLAAQDSPERLALRELKNLDSIFKFEKSDEDTIEGITAFNDPAIKVRKTDLPGAETMWTLTLPSGRAARITVRKASQRASEFDPDTRVFGYDVSPGDGSYTPIMTRPGENAESVEDREDVWIDVSQLRRGDNGAMIYNIAANFAFNTNRVFIGDPNSLTKAAARRRLEHMLSSALKFGTTRHIAPSFEQVEGRYGMRPLRWVYGDTLGNIERMIDVSLDSLKDAGALGRVLFDLKTGRYTDADGQPLSPDDLQRIAEGDGRRADAGAGSLRRAAVLDAIRRAVRQDAERGAGGEGRGTEGRAVSSAADRRGQEGSADAGGAAPAGRLLDDAALREEGGEERGDDGAPVGLLARLVALAGEHTQAAEGLFYARVAPEESGPFGADYSRLKGRKVSYPVLIQETGETANVTSDARQMMRDFDGRIATMRKLLDCLA